MFFTLSSTSMDSHSILPISQSQLLSKNPQLSILKTPKIHFPMDISPRKSRMVVASASASSASATGPNPKKNQPPQVTGFAAEMRLTTLKTHTKEEAKEGEKEPSGPPVSQWEATKEGCLKFLVDSKLVYDTLERIVQKAAFPEYKEFRNTGLERSVRLAKDLEWFKQQGYGIPELSWPGVYFARYLEDISEKDPQKFICHFYNIYFGQTAGGRIIGKKIADTFDGKELEFYKWDADLSKLQQNVRDKLNKVSQGWSEEEKERCLKETETPLKLGGAITRLILS